MYLLEKIKSETAAKINAIFQQEIVAPADLSYPQNPSHGHLVWPAFKALKVLGKDPAQIADALRKGGFFDDHIIEINQVGPYLNFIFDANKFIHDQMSEQAERRESYGMNMDKKKERIMIEYSNANTHKEIHVGHLRNIALGDAVMRVLRANGYDVVAATYLNDFGIHTAKTIWLYLKEYKDKPLPENKGALLGQIYSQTGQAIGDDEAKKAEVGGIMQQIESRSGEIYDLWKETRQWSIDQFYAIYDELGMKFDVQFYESGFIDEGLALTQDLLAKGVLKKSEGAVIADLSEYGLGVLLFLRSNGTALYPVADVPLAMHKFNDYNVDRSIYLVDSRQSQYLKQLFKVLELLGFKQKMVHLSYEFVKLPGGMMASRTGNVITFDQLKEQGLAKAKAEIVERHPDWDEDKVADNAKKILFGAIKFEMTKVKSDQIITFDIDEAIRFEGFTAAYLQYTYARIQSIIRKSGLGHDVIAQGDLSCLVESQEMDISLKLAKFPEAVCLAGANYDPSVIAKYLFELGQEFNDYYHKVRILDDESCRVPRLKLIKAVSQALENGLRMLGIEVMEEM